MVIHEGDHMVGCNVKRANATSSWMDSYFSDHWFGIAQNYSRRCLTFESDKLSALSGLASYFAERHGQEYHAGIFSGSISEGLLWAPWTPGRLSRPTQYVAPSWSWLSPNGPIKLRAPTRIGSGTDDWDADSPPPLKSTLQNIRFELLPEMEENPYGRLKSGKMKLTGWLKAARLRHVGERRDGISRELEANGKIMTTFSLDFADSALEEGPTTEVKCLRVLQEDDNVLVLRRVEEPGHYERIGIATIDLAWFLEGGFRQESISII
jgi:hypothetical protein